MLFRSDRQGSVNPIVIPNSAQHPEPTPYPPSENEPRHRLGVSFLKSEFISRARTTRHRSGHVCYVLCLGMYILRVSRCKTWLWAACDYSVRGVVFWSPLFLCHIYPGSHLARGLAQAPVSSRKRSTSSTRFELAKSWGSVRGRPLAVRCLRRAAA